jgi:cyanophycinase-like exopeptidase
MNNIISLKRDSLRGAAWAKEFAIDSRDIADSQVTYDTLITYSVIFFRGGNQYEYYNFYRDTKLQDAGVR